MNNPYPPCYGSDEWTREPNKNDPQGKRNADTSATLRAKITCFSCPMRQACLKAAFDREVIPDPEGPATRDYYEHHDWHVWAGYTGNERTRWRLGELNFLPGRTPRPASMQRVYELLSGDDLDDIAQRHGIGVDALTNQFNAYIWALRAESGDSSLSWGVVSETQKSETRNSHQSVRAA